MTTEEENVVSESRIKGVATVLLVDDEPTLLSLSSSILAHAGFEVLAAENEVKAMELFQQKCEGNSCDIQFLVCDINLKGASGILLANQIYGLHPMPVVLMSGDAMHDDLMQNLNFPLLGYFEKPFSIVELAKLLEQHLIEA